ncbi:MAG TPA: hypothetical protein VF473_00905, partial [Cyclobacteriaceae bacterium]
MRVFVEPNRSFTEEIKYVFRTLAHVGNIPLEFVSTPSESQVNFNIAGNFYIDLAKGTFNHEHHFKNDCFIRDPYGEPDYVATIFYMLNTLQEYGTSDVDEIGRFKYANSYQWKFGNIEDNLVDQYSKKIIGQTPSFKSRIFLSHDIDSVNGAVMQDSFFLLKKGNPFPIFKLVFNAALNRPDWLNMDKIMKIEDEHSLKSTFFWLVNKGVINRREVNADYNINDPKIRGAIRSLEAGGWENGLHKSISKETYREELSKLPISTVANRNH